MYRGTILSFRLPSGERLFWLLTFNTVSLGARAEQALRRAVIWRKQRFGSQSGSGSRFVERILSVVATARQQGRNVFALLVDTLQANWSGNPPPSLFCIP